MFEYYLTSANIHFNADTFGENFCLYTEDGQYNELANLLSDETDITIKVAVFREAWVNACVHNKWSEKIPPAVWMYEDRIEIFSNGALPDNFSKADFYRGISRPVNKELTPIYMLRDTSR